MEAWRNIINTALLGTEKRQIDVGDLPAELTGAYELIYANESIDKEEAFLQLAAVASSYRQTGTIPIRNDGTTIEPAPPETFAYCNKHAIRILKDIIELPSASLLKLWLESCQSAQLVVEPEIVPTLLDLATTYAKLQALFVACCGQRGKWLSQFNTEWALYETANEEDLWQNGTTDQRKVVLRKIRQNEPLKATKWLKETWPAEGLNTKTEFLKILETNLSEAELEWLESLANDKSQKVKDLAYAHLRKIPSSSIVKKYWGILKESIVQKKEKALLGMVTKTVLQVQPPNLDEPIFKTGIEKLSNTKELTDDEFVICQMMPHIPPNYWEDHLNALPEQVISLFQKDKTTSKFIPALIDATIRTGNREWALAFLQHEETYDSRLPAMLPNEDREHFILKYFSKDIEKNVMLATKNRSEWSMELTRTIFRHTAKQPYQYNKNFYQESILLLPQAIVGELDRFLPQEEHLKSQWDSLSDYLSNLMTLKTQIIQAFNLK